MVFPPGWTPFAPYLALPQLKGFLNSKGLDADIVDDNILFFDSVLSREYLEPILEELLYQYCRMSDNKCISEEDRELYNRLTRINIYKERILCIEQYKQKLRRKEDVRNKAVYEEIMNVISVALDIINIYYDQDVDFTDINFNRYRRDSIEDVLLASNDRKYNIFWDYYTKTNKGLVNNIIKHDILGLSITSAAQLIPALTLSRIVKKLNPNLIIFWGGNYITRLVQQRLENLVFLFKYIDFISCYEGEYMIQQLAEGKLSKTRFRDDIKNIYNIVYFDGNELCKTEELKFNILDVTCPCFDGFELNKYFNPILVIPLFTSRNCYSNCAFCTISGGTGGNRYATVDMSVIFNYMLSLSEKYNTNYFTFVDETFTFRRMLALANMINEAKRSFKWYTETRFDYRLTDEEAKQLYKGGLRKLQFGLESYNQRILDLMNKRVKKENIKPIIDSCIKNKIAVHLFYIIGFPGETREEAFETINFVKDVLQEAEEKYSLTECSKGVSAFGLEKGSRVYYNPQEYGIEIIQNEKNNLGLGYSYKSLYGLSEKEALLLMKEVLSDDCRRKNINVPIGRLLGEELSLYFGDLLDESAPIDKSIMPSISVVEVSVNPLTMEFGKWLVYYEFSTGNTIVLEKKDDGLTEKEKALLTEYGFLDLSDNNSDCKYKWVINPEIKMDNHSEGTTVYDQITGDELVMTEMAYNTVTFVDGLEQDEAKEILINRGIYSSEEYDNFVDKLRNMHIIIPERVNAI